MLAESRCVNHQLLFCASGAIGKRRLPTMEGDVPVFQLSGGGVRFECPLNPTAYQQMLSAGISLAGCPSPSVPPPPSPHGAPAQGMTPREATATATAPAPAARAADAYEVAGAIDPLPRPAPGSVGGTCRGDAPESQNNVLCQPELYCDNLSGGTCRSCVGIGNMCHNQAQGMCCTGSRCEYSSTGETANGTLASFGVCVAVPKPGDDDGSFYGSAVGPQGEWRVGSGIFG